MLLELQDTSVENINKLMDFARQNNLPLSMIDNVDTDYHLPGKPLTAEQIEQLIEKSRQSGVIDMRHAHEIIRSSLNEG